jgi:hypothetical protein
MDTSNNLDSLQWVKSSASAVGACPEGTRRQARLAGHLMVGDEVQVVCYPPGALQPGSGSWHRPADVAGAVIHHRMPSHPGVAGEPRLPPNPPRPGLAARATRAGSAGQNISSRPATNSSLRTEDRLATSVICPRASDSHSGKA